MTSAFRFDAVLRVRIAERDHCRQELAVALQAASWIVIERDQIQLERDALLTELRQTEIQDDIIPNQELSRRQYANHLGQEIDRLMGTLTELHRLTELRRCELLEADKSVKALEKLAERQTQQRVERSQSVQQREIEETFRRRAS